jgi:DNA invertase Pin-like site-specific DNA recombinase
VKAVVYARYSTENQDSRSIEDQERRCRAYAAARGLQVVDVYADAAVSGTTTARPNLQRLLADAKARRFGAVIVDDLSRLSRDRVDSGVLVRTLDDLGVQVVDAETGARSDDEASDITFAIKGVINSEYVKAIRRQTHRGLEGRALQGFATGGKTYGYSSHQ